MVITYKQAYEDHCYLWKIAPAYDMTGGYVDSEDLDKLLKNPTQATARDCLCAQIDYWFTVGCDDCSRCKDSSLLIETDPIVKKIAKRHGFIRW